MNRVIFGIRGTGPEGDVNTKSQDRTGRGSTLQVAGRRERGRAGPEGALRASHERFVQAERIAHVGHWELRLDPPSRKWSGEVRRIFGIGPDDPVPPLGSEWNGYHPADQDRVRDALKAALDQQEEFSFECRIVRPSGEQRQVVVRGVCEADAAGRATCLFGVCIDVTEIKDTERRLHEAEGRFRLLVESVSDYAIIMLDLEGNVSAWNAGAQRVKGYGADEIVGHHFSRFYTPEDRLAGFPAQALRSALEKGHFEAAGWRVRQDGTRFWSNVSLTPMRDDDGHLVGFAKVTRDMTV